MIIVIAEISFWVIVVAGLLARYVLRMNRLSNILLAVVPLVDIVVLIVTILDLREGRSIEFAHQVVELYLGLSLILGPSTIRWCDEKMHGMLKHEGSQRISKKLEWRDSMLRELIFLAKWSVAVGISWMINQGLIFVAVNDSQREAIQKAAIMPLNKILIVALFGPVWQLFSKYETNKSTRYVLCKYLSDYLCCRVRMDCRNMLVLFK